MSNAEIADRMLNRMVELTYDGITTAQGMILAMTDFRNSIVREDERTPCKHVMKPMAVRMCIHCDWVQMID